MSHLRLPVSPFSADRVAAHRAFYAEGVAPRVGSVLAKYHKAFKAGLPAGFLQLGGLIAGAWLFFTTEWPEGSWWTDRDTLLRLALVAVVGLGTFALGAWLGSPSQSKKQEAARRFARELLPAVFSAFRPGARYKPDAAISEKWMRRSAIVKLGNRYESGHEVRWTADDVSIRLASALAERVRRRASGEGTDTTTHFKGLVAVVDLPMAAGGYLRCRPTRAGAVEPEVVVDVARIEAGSTSLGSAYQVDASSPDLARGLLTPGLIELLAEAARERVVLHVAIAHREVYVAIEQSRIWFDDITHRFNEEHFVGVAQTIEIVERVVAEVVSALRWTTRSQ